MCVVVLIPSWAITVIFIVVLIPNCGRTVIWPVGVPGAAITDPSEDKVALGSVLIAVIVTLSTRRPTVTA